MKYSEKDFNGNKEENDVLRRFCLMVNDCGVGVNTAFAALKNQMSERLYKWLKSKE